MTKQNFAAIAVVIDESGSMSRLQADTIGGFNTFLNEQKALPGDAILTLTKFNTQATTVYDCVPLKDVAELSTATYHPSGGTALLDALGMTIDNLGRRLSVMSEEERPSRVVVLVITDGEENSSREYANSKIKEMVEHQQSKYSWEFLFIGANVDAFAAGTSLGFSTQNSVRYTASATGTHRLYSEVSKGLASVRSGEVKTGDSILGTNSIETEPKEVNTTVRTAYGVGTLIVPTDTK